MSAKFIFSLGFTAVLVIVFAQNVSAKPYSRVKRVSDQRLAELETLVALSKMSGKLVTVPLGYGKVDPKFIGRKRRSQARLLDRLFNTSEDEFADVEDPPERIILNYEDLLYNNR